MAAIAICVNPMSGRDVRRLAARATNMTHEAKRDIVARIAAGADALGVADIFVTKEPFRIASMALEWMDLRAKVHLLETPLNHDATDTEAAIAAFLDAGVRTIVSVGGDGTNRAIARATMRRSAAEGGHDVELIPLSTGTNNVFPTLVEPTIAGMVAGLSATGRVRAEGLKQRCKILHVRFSDQGQDVGLVDAVLLHNDYVGNLLPFDERKLVRMLLTRAEPDAIGMSPIGGFLDVVESTDEFGLLVEMGPGREVEAPLSPGHFRTVSIKQTTRIPIGVPVVFPGTGVLALDGDRDHRLHEDRSATVTIQRDGPWVFDVPAVMRYAVREGMMSTGAFLG
ncbi:MAG: NAD(+)/NADH kinase [Gammaproteobacteria bacterium]|nr:NAD(+)/NADH kinase [Gammaproteobacteria bacterium]